MKGPLSTCLISAEISAKISAEISAEILAEISAEISAEILAEISAEISAAISAEHFPGCPLPRFQANLSHLVGLCLTMGSVCRLTFKAHLTWPAFDRTPAILTCGRRGV